MAEAGCSYYADDCHAVNFRYGINNKGACSVAFECFDETDPDGTVCPTGEKHATAPGTSESACGGYDLGDGHVPPGPDTDGDDTDTDYPRIEVRASRLHRPVADWAWHHYLVWVSGPDSDEDVKFEGGAKGPCIGACLPIGWGTVNVTIGGTGTRTDSDRKVTVASRDTANDAYGCLVLVSEYIRDACACYNPLFGPNSNTVASTLLLACGLPVQSPLSDFELSTAFGWYHAPIVS